MRCALSLIAIFASAAFSNAADNWPQFRGPHGDGHADAKDVPITWSETENVKWKTAIHDKGWSSPVIWGNQIWLTTAKEKYAENAPKENAAQKIPKPDWVELYAVCIDKASGKILHDVMLRKAIKPDYCNSYNSFATPTPVLEEGRVYLHFGENGTFCIDATSGKTIWERLDLKCDHWRGAASSPIIHGDLMYLTFDGYDVQYVEALNKKDGTTAWHKDRNIKFPSTNGDLKKAYSTPSILVVDGKPQLISPAAEATIAYDPASGDELWRVIHGGMNEACKPVFGHGLIYLTTGHNPTVLAMKQGMKGTISKEDAVWKTIKAAPSRPSLLLDGDLLYMVSDLGFAACVDAKTGEQKWQERFGAKFDASPVLAAGHIFISDTEGKTHVIATGAAFKSVAINKLDAGCMGSIAVSGNELFIRTKTHLYCIAKK